VKIPTTAINPSTTQAWLEGIADRELAERFKAWMKEFKKDKLPTIYISLAYVQSYGIPFEIIQVMDIKKIIMDLTGTDRLVLESLGYFPKSDMLISELGY
jgi:hypothetical protein